jgi:hypothetical protein
MVGVDIFFLFFFLSFSGLQNIHWTHHHFHWRSLLLDIFTSFAIIFNSSDSPHLIIDFWAFFFPVLETLLESSASSLPERSTSELSLAVFVDFEILSSNSSLSCSSKLVFLPFCSSLLSCFEADSFSFLL